MRDDFFRSLFSRAVSQLFYRSLDFFSNLFSPCDLFLKRKAAFEFRVNHLPQ